MSGDSARIAAAIDSMSGPADPCTFHVRRTTATRLAGPPRPGQCRTTGVPDSATMSKVAFLGLGVMGAPDGPASGEGRATRSSSTTARRPRRSPGWHSTAIERRRRRPRQLPTPTSWRCASATTTTFARSSSVPRGALAAMSAGSVLIDHTTASAGVARELVGGVRRTRRRIRRCPGVGWPGGSRERPAHGDVRVRRRRGVRPGRGGRSTRTPSRVSGSARPAPGSSPRWSTRSASPASSRASPKA